MTLQDFDKLLNLIRSSDISYGDAERQFMHQTVQALIQDKDEFQKSILLPYRTELIAYMFEQKAAMAVGGTQPRSSSRLLII